MAYIGQSYVMYACNKLATMLVTKKKKHDLVITLEIELLIMSSPAPQQHLVVP